jgi:hypothetical protein
MEPSREELDAALEGIAIDLHHHTSAMEAHHTIATQMWGHIKALEYTGRLLAFGRDAEILAGAPPDESRTLDDFTIDGQALSKDVADRILLAGELPPATQWPHRDLNFDPIDVHTVDAVEGDTADVVIANLPWADTRILTRGGQVDIAMNHHSLIRRALTWLRPGGLLVALAHRQLLEGTDAQPRRSIAKHADLIAASRLPASALRHAPLLDSPVDLLMLRRREPGHPPMGLPFIRRTPVHVHEHPDMLINECYALASWAVLGDIVPDPVQPGMTTAAPFGGAFGVDLGDVLHDQTTIAIDFELHAQIRPTPSYQPHPTSPANEPRNPAPGTDEPSL